MSKLYRVTVFYFLSISAIFSQEKEGQVLDFATHEPIPYATLVYGTSGVITNEDGKFSINDYGEMKEVSISCLGYETRTLALENLGEEPVLMRAAAIDLDAVFLDSKPLSGLELIQQVKARVESNYNFDPSLKRFFWRESNKNSINQFDIKISESSIAELDQALMDSITGSVPKFNDSYIEVLGDLYGNYEQQQLKLLKAADLYNPASTVSLDSMMKKLEGIFDKNVKKDSYFKIRSGLMGVSVDADDLMEENEGDETKDTTTVKQTAEDIEKERLKRRDELKEHSRDKIKELLQSSFWVHDLPFDLFENPKKYSFTLQGYTSINGEFAYILQFEPRRNSRFKGKLYVNTIDFGVYRLDFENVKPLRRFRLLGIATAEDVYRGKMIYEKDDSGRYNLKYMEHEEGASLGIDRPLTVIEKNKHVVGKRKQNELDMDVFFKNSEINLYQLVVFQSKNIPEEDFVEDQNNATFDYEKFKQYNPDFWKDYTIIEPNEAIQAFSLPKE